MIRTIFALLITLAFAAPAYAVPMVGEAAQTCALGVTFNQKGAQNAQRYNACPTLDPSETYKSVRVEQGEALAPIDRHNMCYFIDNYSENAFFVPINTPQEWNAFIQSKPDLVRTVECCRPVTFSNSDTCGETVTLGNYTRDGHLDNNNGLPNVHTVGSEGRTLSYRCGANGQWELAQTNGASCGALAAGGASELLVGEVRATLQGYATQRNFTN